MIFVDVDEVLKILRRTTNLQEIIREIDELPTIKAVGGCAEYDIHTLTLKLSEITLEGVSPNDLYRLFE